MLIPVMWRGCILTESEANLCWLSTSLVLLAPFAWLMGECGPEEKAHVTCVPQLQTQEAVFLLLPLTLLRRQLFDQIVAICRAQIKPGLLYCQSQAWGICSMSYMCGRCMVAFGEQEAVLLLLLGGHTATEQCQIVKPVMYLSWRLIFQYCTHPTLLCVLVSTCAAGLVRSFPLKSEVALKSIALLSLNSPVMPEELSCQ